jgi:hypothetical protein
MPGSLKKFSHRHCLPVRLSLGGYSFQFGRTSLCRPRAPHLAHTTLLAKDATSSSSGFFETSIKPWWRHTSLRHVATRWCIPRWRMLPSIIRSPGGWTATNSLGLYIDGSLSTLYLF